MRVLGISAIFPDRSAALVADDQIVTAAREERFSRRKHTKWPAPFTAWEPGQPAPWCDFAGFDAGDLAVACSYHPSPTHRAAEFRLHGPCDRLRRTYAQHALWVRPRRWTGSISRLCPRSATTRRTPLLQVSCAVPIGPPTSRR
jgi:hypothetical protein